MSDKAVRLAIQEFFAYPELPGIQRVYKDIPWFIDGAQWDVASNNGWAAVAAVHLSTSNESRATLPWKTGQKEVDHTVGLVVQYQYLIPPQFTHDEAEDVWVDGFDTVIDGIKDRIRSDYTFNNPAVIFQAGENKNDIRITRDAPYIDKGRVLVWAVLEFDVTEIITA
jgi:hypothetical protein